MKFDANKLASAVRLALTMGTVTAVGAVGTAYAQNTDSTTTDSKKSQNLETIVVTGSNIRRVDLETANPVVTIDRAAIEQSGKVNLGDLVQELPSMAGAATNPAVNNGGGTGASTVSLRGLGSNRTLLLINGHRVPFQIQDLNIIPINAVERIDVLNDGASAVYGSDAIGGVVNIITRTNYQGAEFGADFGETDQDDGMRRSFRAMFGQSTDHGNIIFGVQYDKTDPVLAANRKYSHDALYNNTYYGVQASGSSRTPGGYLTLPSSLQGQFGGCSSVTLSGPATGAVNSSNYRCYKSATDAFNFQAVGNYDEVPQERTHLFALGNYKLTDNVTAYLEAFHTKTTSKSQLAPVPYDAQTDGYPITSNQYYNPFPGVTFGPGDSEFRSRLTTLGDRGRSFGTTVDLDNAGLKGNFGDSSWSWDVHGSIAHEQQNSQNLNYINYASIASSFSCPTAPGPGAACTPINLFNVNDPSTIALLDSARIDPFTSFMYSMKSVEGSVNGTLFSLPAGDVQLAFGGSYRKEYVDGQVDPLINTNISNVGGAIFLSCAGPGSICGASTQGGYDVKEAYAELLIPLLKDLPFVHSLNLDLGDRFSKYNEFGSTNNWKVAIEFRPIEDLLLRATASKVFRAPTVSNLYTGPGQDNPAATDPCAGDGTNLAIANNRACGGYTNIPTQTLSQISSEVVGSNWANSNLNTQLALKPEYGKSFDYGFVYDPQFVQGLSVSGDYYRIVLNNLINSGVGEAQTILTQCFNTQSDICNLISRNSDGSLRYVFEIPYNAGTLVTQGFDLGMHYKLPETSFGNFRLGLDTTYIQKYNITEGDFTQSLAGHYDRTYGNFVRVRALGSLDWNLGNFSANWTLRYFSPLTVGYACADLGPSAASSASVGPDGCYDVSPVTGKNYNVQHFGAMTYSNISFGYNIQPLNTLVQVGIDNINNKLPPLISQSSGLNANTDTSTYDTVGRYFWGKVTVKF